MTETALFADVEKRTVRGLLLPFGELSAPSVSKTEPIMFAKGTVDLPEDVTVLNANRLHSQHHPVARFASVIETDAGIEAEFSIARGKDGDELLADVDSGKLAKLSAEIRDLVRDGAKAVKARLTGAAFVPKGAFESAALFALADDEADDLAKRIKTAVDAAIQELKTPEDSPSEVSEEKEETMTAQAAVVPDGLNPPADAKKEATANALFAALAHAGQTKDTAALESLGIKGADALFAISTIQHSGPSTVTIGADVQVPQAVNEIWTRRRYERRFVPLFNQAALTSLKVMGWKWDPAKEPAVAAYSGNTAEIPSNAVDTIPVTADARRIAGGHKLDRRFIDFGDQSVYESYFDKMTESYSRVTDLDILAKAVAAATATTAGTVPSGTSEGLAGIVDGALAVIATENTPSFAVVSPELWRDIALTGRDEVLGYLNASFGLEEGSLGAPQFRIIPGPVGAGNVLVGAKEAMTVYELPGVPIRVEGLDPHHGAIDPALFGYLAEIVNNAAALALVDTDPA